MLSWRAECSKNGLCAVASAPPPRRRGWGAARSPAGNCPALPLSRRPPRARDGDYSDSLLQFRMRTWKLYNFRSAGGGTSDYFRKNTAWQFCFCGGPGAVGSTAARRIAVVEDRHRLGLARRGGPDLG